MSRHASASAADYDLVVATRDHHVDPGPHFAATGAEPDFATTWPAHCVAGTDGAAWHEDLRLPPGTVVVSKGAHAAAYSGFEATTDDGRSLDTVLRAAAIEAVDVVGLATSFCNAATAADAAAGGYRTRLLLDLCADVPGADTAATVSRLREAGVEVVGEAPA